MNALFVITNFQIKSKKIILILSSGIQIEDLRE